jgi:polyisoprenoid-binding protein YceI
MVTRYAAFERKPKMRNFRLTSIALLSLAIIAPLAAQDAAPQPTPGQPDVTRVTAGTYQTDPMHSLIGFRVNHLGFNDYFGVFGDAAGTLVIDPANPGAARVDITVPVSGLSTANGKLTEHMKGTDFFDSAKFPAVRFVSTKVTATGTNALIEGDLTIRGVTRKVTLDTKFTGAGTNTFAKKETIGFEAATVIKRSDFGMGYGVPFVSDDVRLDITVAFEKG